jgi:hypothetical protein
VKKNEGQKSRETVPLNSHYIFKYFDSDFYLLMQNKQDTRNTRKKLACKLTLCSYDA